MHKLEIFKVIHCEGNIPNNNDINSRLRGDKTGNEITNNSNLGSHLISSNSRTNSSINPPLKNNPNTPFITATKTVRTTESIVSPVVGVNNNIVQSNKPLIDLRDTSIKSGLIEKGKEAIGIFSQDFKNNPVSRASVQYSDLPSSVLNKSSTSISDSLIKQSPVLEGLENNTGLHKFNPEIMEESIDKDDIELYNMSDNLNSKLKSSSHNIKKQRSFIDLVHSFKKNFISNDTDKKIIPDIIVTDTNEESIKISKEVVKADNQLNLANKVRKVRSLSDMVNDTFKKIIYKKKNPFKLIQDLKLIEKNNDNIINSIMINNDLILPEDIEILTKFNHFNFLDDEVRDNIFKNVKMLFCNKSF
jgi:hypothetical protein